MLFITHDKPFGHFPVAVFHVHHRVGRHRPRINSRGNDNAFKRRTRLIGKLERKRLSGLGRIRSGSQDVTRMGILDNGNGVLRVIEFHGFGQGALGIKLSCLVNG